MNTSFINLILYDLKKLYGGKIYIYRLDSSTIDVDTGQVDARTQRHVVRKAIVLPGGLMRKFSYDLVFVAANKNFTVGGHYDLSTKDFVIALRDLPRSFEPKLDDYIEFENKKYTIRDITEFEYGQAVIITAKHLDGEPLLKQINASITSTLTISQEATDELQ